MSSPDEQAIIAAVKAHYAKVRSLDVSHVADTDFGDQMVHREGTTMVEFRPDDPGFPSRFHVDTKERGPAYRRARDGTTTTVMQDIRTIRIFDGSVYMTFKGYSGGPGAEYDHPSGKVTGKHDGVGLWTAAVFPVSDWPINRLLEKPSVSGPIGWNSRSVYVVDGYYGVRADTMQNNIRFYVDPRRDFTMVYSESRTKGGNVWQQTEVVDLVDCDGNWLTSKYESTSFRADGAVKTVGSIVYLHVNQEFSPADFLMAWPDGTHVRDEVANRNYTVGRK